MIRLKKLLKEQVASKTNPTGLDLTPSDIEVQPGEVTDEKGITRLLSLASTLAENALFGITGKMANVYDSPAAYTGKMRDGLVKQVNIVDPSKGNIAGDINTPIGPNTAIKDAFSDKQ